MPALDGPDRLRVGYVAKVFPRLSETFVINEVRELEAQGVDVVVFALQEPPAAVPHRLLETLSARVIQVETLPRPARAACDAAAVVLAGRFPDAATLGDRLLPRNYVRLALQLADAARGASLSRFHAHFASRAAHVTMLTSRLLGVPYSFTAHAKDIYHRDVDVEVLRVKMREADLAVTVSDFNRATLLRIGHGIPDLGRQVRRLYNGVDLALFHPARPEEKRRRHITAVGRLVEKKGFSTLIQACRILRDRGVAFTAEIIGSGPEQERLQSLLQDLQLGGVVHLRGALPVEEVAATVRRASVVALPCIVGTDGNVDALPTALLEAMASAVPVISTRLSGIPEIIVDGQTGHLVPPGEVAALAAVLQDVLDDPDGAARLGAAGRERAERLFDLHANVAQLRGWFADLAGRSRAP